MSESLLGIITCTLTCFPFPQVDVMWFWVLNGYTHLDPSYGILLNFGCSFQSMGKNTHWKAYNQGLSTSSVHIAWKKSLRRVPMVSSLSSIPFKCNPQRPPLLLWISNKFWIDIQVFFSEPVGLPPSRPEDHHIQLLPGSIPPNIRPYHYPFHHKTKIKMLFLELRKCIILHSTSSFS